MKPSISLVSSLTFCLVGSSLQLNPASAQVTADSTTNTTVNPDGDNFIIEQGDRVGDNLFHSFNEFSVPTMGSAAFNNASDIANIFSRVTGSNISSIDGLISANGTANLYLINPNGIIFGENARLDLGGSFFASTADSLLFDGGLEFSASNPTAPPLLEVNIPIGLGFRDNPGEIINRSFVLNSTAEENVGLEVASGKNLTLVGGDINFEAGEATARGGNIQLGGLSAAGTVGISDDGSLNFPEAVERADITLSNAADVDVRGTGGGSITVNARNLKLEAGELGFSQLRAGIIADSTSADVQAEDITINATDNVTVDDSVIQNLVASGAVGNAGDINITARSLSLTNGAQLNSDTSGEGDAGLISVQATEKVELSGDGTAIFSDVNSTAKGNGGRILIETGDLVVNNSAELNSNTWGQGDAGTINIKARSISLSDSLVSSTVSPNASGQGGQVSITTSSLTLSKFSVISTGTLGKTGENGRSNAGTIEINISDTLEAIDGSVLFSATAGEGDAGNININGEGATISFDGVDNDGLPSTIFTSVGQGAVGRAGDIFITAKSFDLTNGAVISSGSTGQGNAGSINITATDSVNLTNGAAIASSVTRQGDAGSINITATDSVNLTNGAVIDSSTLGEGNAGNLTIEALDGTVSLDGSYIRSRVEEEAKGNAGNTDITTKNFFLINGAQLSSSTFGQGDAGSVKINAINTVSLDGEDKEGFPSAVFSTVEARAVGNGGDINITARSLSLTDGAQLDSDTSGEGDAGLISVQATEKVELSGDGTAIFSDVNSTAKGNGGRILFETGELSFINGAQLSSSTFGQGNAGKITITADTLEATENSTVQTNTASSGQAGDITLNIRDNFNLTASAIEATTSDDSTGNGGNISIDPIQVNLTDGAKISVNSQGLGDGGSIFLIAENLTLGKSSEISAATVSGEGGNINLTIAEDIFFKNSSLISARAFGNANGGNVTINADNGSIVAFPNQNNDIIANAQQGNGGNINITTQGIFGLEERSSTPDNQTNDIDASSEFGLQGSFSLNTPENEPSRGLVDLPENVVNPEDLISQNACKQRGQSKFTLTGRGGLPSTPEQVHHSDEVEVGLVEPAMGVAAVSKESTVSEDSTKIVPAKGWIRNERGEVFLVGYDPTQSNISSSQPENLNLCQPQ